MAINGYEWLLMVINSDSWWLMMIYPLVNSQSAIEHGHRNGLFTPFNMVMSHGYGGLPEGSKVIDTYRWIRNKRSRWIDRQTSNTGTHTGLCIYMYICTYMHTHIYIYNMYI